MNSLYNQLSKSLSLPPNIKNMVQMIKGMSNPQSMLNDMASKNPQLKSILQASNGNYEQAFRTLAKQMNVNPDEIISMLK